MAAACIFKRYPLGYAASYWYNKEMKKKMFLVMLGMFLLFTTQSISVHAEPSYSDTNYWSSLCTRTDLSNEQVKACNAFMEFTKQNNPNLRSQLEAIDARKADIAANSAKYAGQLASYNSQINSLQGMIADLNEQIEDVDRQVKDLEQQIEDSRRQVEEKQKAIEELKKKIKTRLAAAQENLRVSPLLDVLMGAQSFNDTLRIINGVESVEGYDLNMMTQLNTTIQQLRDLEDSLHGQIDDLKQKQTELEQGRNALTQQQATMLAARYQAQLVADSYARQMNLANSNLSSVLNAVTKNGNGEQSATNQNAFYVAPGEGTEQAQGNNPYYGGWGNCTWGAWQLVHDRLGISLPRFPGNAGNWLNAAIANGMATGSQPQANSIAVYAYHVAFVAEVDGNRVHILEGNYNGGYGDRWVAADYRSCSGYIYL